MEVRTVLFAFALAGLLCGCGDGSASGGGAADYRTARIERMDIVSTVTGTGTVTPRNTASGIPVGAQVNGKIIRLYVDYNDTVTNNQAVAEIDPLVYEANYKSALAQLNVRRRGVEEAECTVRSRRAELQLAEKTYRRKQSLVGRKMASVADFDSAEEAFLKAQAALDSAEAALKSAQANVLASEAAVDQARANLDYCTIRSPVNGIVIDRKVEFGETVVSSMNAVPVLTIAEDLDVVWISSDIPESDIGDIRPGQPVTFTVDAYKEGGRLRKFSGVVRQVRKASTVTNNVVTFPVIVEADNPGQLLFPGMTATLSIETGRAANVLAVPSAALRFRPRAGAAESATERPAGTSCIYLAGGEPAADPRPVWIKTGTSDGAWFEIKADDAENLEGAEVIVGYQPTGAKAGEKAKNPFMPKHPKRGTKGTAPVKK